MENSASGSRFPDFEVEPDVGITETLPVTEESESDLVLVSRKISKKTRKTDNLKQKKYLSKINGKWKRFNHENAKKLFKVNFIPISDHIIWSIHYESYHLGHIIWLISYGSYHMVHIMYLMDHLLI